jgi:general stress protein YciG
MVIVRDIKNRYRRQRSVAFRMLLPIFSVRQRKILRQGDRQTSVPSGEETYMTTSKSGNFADDPKKASEAGRKGGQVSGGSFADDPARAAEAGAKGGQSSDTEKGGGRSGGNFKNDPEKVSEAGHKGGSK